nr:unnamed protein product [Callosobruchus chinensis]
MKRFAVVAVVLFASAVFAEEAKKEAEDDKPKTYRRLIPADVLRDFPGMCFASTKCATVEPGKTWDLTPFCGRSTCVVSEDKPPRLLELVEDCGPLPLANPKCKLDEGKGIFMDLDLCKKGHEVYFQVRGS